MFPVELSCEPNSLSQQVWYVPVLTVSSSAMEGAHSHQVGMNLIKQHTPANKLMPIQRRGWIKVGHLEDACGNLP